MTTSIILLVLLALFFDFLNGFHDSANSIATIVSTRVLSPRHAVLWAAFFNFAAFLIFKTHVAATISKGIVSVDVIDTRIILATLVGACVWDLVTWYFGLPTSSSHALMGGLIGAALVKAGPGSLVMSGIIKTVLFIVVSPLLGMAIGMLNGVAMMWICRRTPPGKVDSVFRVGQLLSAAAYSLGHGGNDAQKTMGIIAGLMVSAGFMARDFTEIPIWIVLSCHSAIALGTMFGGWRIVKTMGQKVAKLRPVDGFCAEFGAATALFVSSGLGVPVSTTHTITGAIMGVGSLRRRSAVRWGVAGQIVWAWVLTIPCAALVSAVVYYAARAIK
ncbi:MAG: inorganic phosphate transporter [Candidatus Edwardsbacteria bacterium]|jgi:PiT family inorganic phosphate transporter|nr:inorganic phosphate transporter [Candidatus Edwardsbacteria bacterium]